jgi:hypothetical protein
MLQLLTNASIVAVASTLTGIVPLAVGVVYAVWPSEARLALLRPLSLATIFAALAGSVLGLLNVLRGLGIGRGVEFGPLEVSRISAVGLAESLVPLFVAFGCLTITWLAVAIGMWRRP